MSRLSLLPFAARLRPAIAAGCAALVLALTLLAVSPVAHGRLHADTDHGTRGDACAVVLFATSATVPFAAIVVPRPCERPQATATAASADILLIAPRYLWQPERGPPAVQAS